jgi:hypothetical protein
MASSSHDFVTVDMRGLKAALVARAQAERASVSAVVRRAVARELGQRDGSHEPARAGHIADGTGSTVKLSLRLTVLEAEQLAAGAKRAALSRGAFLAGLMAGLPSLTSASASRPDCISALTASNAELSSLTRSINHLSALLRQGDVQAAREYRRLLDTLVEDVRAHLRLAGGVLSDLRPTRRAPGSSDVPRQPTAARGEGDGHGRTS